MILLDTTVLIDFLRGDQSVAERLRERRVGLFLTSAIVVEELSYGIRSGEEEEEEVVHGLVDGLEVVAVGRDEAALAARWRREHARGGVTLSQPDCLIAACAVTRGVPLATANVRHFPMPELTVEHWPSDG